MFKIKNMKNFLFLVILTLSFSSIGQSKLEFIQVDQNKLLKDIVYTYSGNNQITILYWFPEMYWEVMAAKDPKSIPPEVIAQLKQMLGNKSIFFAVQGKMNGGTFEAKEDSYLRNNISVAFNGKTYKPIADAKLSDDLKMLNSYLKPMFSQMLGDMGSGMSIFYFEIADSEGENLLSPYSNVDFTLGLGSVKHAFHLPLPSLFEDSKCANDGELFPANYEFCPYHGSKLITQ